MDTPAEDQTQRRWEGATDGWLERAEAEQPMGKLIKPEEIAHTIVHLCSPESGFLTGQDIDWDQTIVGVGPTVFARAPSSANSHRSCGRDGAGRRDRGRRHGGVPRPPRRRPGRR